MFFSATEHQNLLLLRFCAPDSGNAMSLAVARELASLRKRHSRWKGVVAVQSGHPTLFCSGGNLSDYKKMKGRAPGLKVNREITRCLDTFAAWPVVKVALVEGDVLGGGLEWLARFDFRWSTPYALFSFWQKRIGLSPGWGGGRAWTAKLGEERVRALLLEARLLSADRALSIGLVDRLIDSQRMQVELADFTSGLASVEAGGSTEKLLRWSTKREVETFNSLWLGPEHKRALTRWKPK